MKNLIKKIVPVIALAGAGLIGCATSPPVSDRNLQEPPRIAFVKPEPDYSKLINLRNSYFASSYLAADIIDLEASAAVGEALIKKTDKGYERIPTYYRASDKRWDDLFDFSCRLADANKDNIIDDEEARNSLDLAYEVQEQRLHEIQWVEDDEDLSD